MKWTLFSNRLQFESKHAKTKRHHTNDTSCRIGRVGGTCAKPSAPTHHSPLPHPLFPSILPTQCIIKAITVIYHCFYRNNIKAEEKVILLVRLCLVLLKTTSQQNVIARPPMKLCNVFGLPVFVLKVAGWKILLGKKDYANSETFERNLPVKSYSLCRYLNPLFTPVGLF